VTIELLATCYGVAMSLAPLLQAQKMKRRRSSADFSLPYMTVLLVGFLIYLIYGISIGNRVLVVTNTVSVIATAMTVLVAASLRRTDDTSLRGRRSLEQDRC
jgi:uncharacterized protein with PQ loop repeat